MNKIKRIVFMGTPEFAVASLAALVDTSYDIVGVITAPDKPAGRGKKISMSAVKEFALEKGLKVLQPTNLKSPEFQAELASLKADIQVVVAFRMLPKAVWNMPPYGTINVHGSLLPQYRGAAPIHWAVINGEKETGVTTFLLQHEIDTGKIIFQDKTTISTEDTTGTVYNRLMNMGAALIVKTVDAVNEGDYPQIPQDHIKDIKHAPKIYKEDCKVDWTKDAESIFNFIRGLNPFPGAFTTLDDLTLKLFASEIAHTERQLKPGEILLENKQWLVGTGDGVLALKEIQLQGKKRMDATSFINGYTFPTQLLH